ncbi:MAG TPA: MauE/DoxX family redox-associated membrane protein [Mucilaginibacter sp.]|nr:MauE/DoxX family redox-associated membrane protein [Mucilaginibacter sp.]
MKFVKKASLVLMIIGYLIAGANHFRSPGTYIPLIPEYLPLPELLNTIAGFFELLFGSMLMFRPTRRIAAWGIFTLLVLFIPAHVDMILKAPFKIEKLQVTPFIAWLRLLIFQPLLMLWAWWHTKED